MGIIKLLIKLAIAALIANAAWRLGSAYATFYRFKDALAETSQFSARKSEGELQQRIVELATQFELPIDGGDFAIRRQNNHTYVDGSYTLPVELLPGKPFDWSFTFKVDTLSIDAPAAPTPPR